MTSAASEKDSSTDPPSSVPDAQNSATAERIASGIAWGTIARIGQIVGTLIANMVLARLLVRNDFGLVNMSAVFLNVANSFADFGIKTYIIQSKSLNEDQWKAAQFFSWLIGSLIFFVGVIAAFPLANFYHEPKLVAVLIVQSSMYVIASATSVHTAMITRRLDFRRTAGIDVIANLIYPLVACSLAFAGARHWSLVLGRLAAAIFALRMVVPSWSAALPHWVPWEKLRPIFGFGSLLSLSSALNQLDENIDNIVVGKVFGTAELGLYATAYNVAALPQRYISFMVAGVVMPVLARATDREEIGKATAHFVRFQVLIPAAIAMSFSVMAPELCRVLLGARWPDAPRLVAVMSYSSAALSVSTVIGAVLLSQGFAKVLFFFSAFKLAGLAIGVFAGMHWGSVGVAIGFAIANAITVISGLGLSGVMLGISAWRIPLALVRPCVVVAIAVAVQWALIKPVRTLHLPALASLAIVGGVGAIVMLIIAKFLCPQEWEQVMRVVRRKPAQ